MTGLVVEARTTTPVRTVARARSGQKGEFRLEIPDVAATRKQLGLSDEQPLTFTLAALEGRRIVARSDGAFEAKPGESVTASLRPG